MPWHFLWHASTAVRGSNYKKCCSSSPRAENVSLNRDPLLACHKNFHGAKSARNYPISLNFQKFIFLNFLRTTLLNRLCLCIHGTIPSEKSSKGGAWCSKCRKLFIKCSVLRNHRAVLHGASSVQICLWKFLIWEFTRLCSIGSWAYSPPRLEVWWPEASRV